MRRISLKQQILCRTAMDFDIPPANPEEPPGNNQPIRDLDTDQLTNRRGGHKHPGVAGGLSWSDS